MEAYCLKCKKKSEMKEEKEETTKNGRKIIKGICDVCGKKMCKFVKAK